MRLVALLIVNCHHAPIGFATSLLTLFSFIVTSVSSSAITSPFPVPTPTRGHIHLDLQLDFLVRFALVYSPNHRTNTAVANGRAGFPDMGSISIIGIHDFGGPSTGLQTPSDPDPLFLRLRRYMPHILYLSPSSSSSSCSTG